MLVTHEAASSLRRFARAIAKENPKLLRMSGFSAEMWWDWRERIKKRTRWPGQINMARCLLYDVSSLPDSTRQAMSAREKKPKSREYESYTVSEFRRIYAAAWSAVRSAKKRIRINMRYVNEFQDGKEPKNAPFILIKSEKWTRGRILNHLFETGHLPDGGIPHCWRSKCREMFSLQTDQPINLSIFASTAEVYAGITLLVCERGFNMSTVNQLVAEPHIAGVGTQAAKIQSFDKPRRGPNSRYFSSSFTGKSGRIWESLHELTQPARDHLLQQGETSNRLLIGRVSSGRAKDGAFKSDWNFSSYLSKSLHALKNIYMDSGKPMVVDLRRLRLTEQVLNQKSNQNSERISESIYRGPDKQTKELAKTVILKGQSDALADAVAVTTIRMLSEKDVKKSQSDPKQLANKLNVSMSRVKQILKGKHDTVASACLNIKDSPYSQKGEACDVSFFKCFGCRNAIVTPKHLPRLVLLHEAISELESVVSAVVWDTDYSIVHQQLTALLFNFSTAEEQDQARIEASERDREAIRELLDGHYDT